MKNPKLTGFFIAGFLALFMAGCFNPISVIPPTPIDAAIEPFSVDVYIGADQVVPRAIAGADADRIRKGLLNIVQLIVINGDGEVVAFDEVRREQDSDEKATLVIDALPFGRTYYFLLLMGHWERNYEAENGNGAYVYAAGPPTLLASGFHEQLVTKAGKVTITMWPIVVDTVFTSGSQTMEPSVNEGKPGMALLSPGNWTVSWTLKRGFSGNGLAGLIQAQNAAGITGNTLEVQSKKTMVRPGTGNPSWDNNAVLNGNVITRSLAGYTENFRNAGGSTNFNLEYVPFNLTAKGKNPWARFNMDSEFDLSDMNVPVWIIRNGVNDLVQNDKTDFNSLGNGTANGNGAVRFGIEPQTPHDGSDLTIYDGEFFPGTTWPDIGFTTGGYTGDAEVYYAVVPHGNDAPGYPEYKLLKDTAGPGPHRKQIELEDGNYDIYVFVYQAGKMSYPLIINTAGEPEGNWEWGDEPAINYYVSSYGNDNASGAKTAPLATVKKALEKMAAKYAEAWPGKGTSQENPGTIVILDKVTVTEQIVINNNGSIYPHIILTDELKTPAGKLQANRSIGSGNSLLRIENGAKVTLDGGLALTGTNFQGDNIRGVYVTTSGEFTMKGGQISAYNSAGGVYINGTFTMTGGQISGNAVSGTNAQGGGVYFAGGTFTMTGGQISGNSVSGSGNVSYIRGGGVYFAGGTFIMTGGQISGNSSISNSTSSPPTGGGVYFVGGTFTMTGGQISNNTISVHGHGGAGAGVYMYNGTFNLNGGEISGNSSMQNGVNGSTSGGGVIVREGTFTMTSGKISDNTIHYGNGGGVVVGGGTFNLNGGEISGNAISVSGNGNGGGGGVYVFRGTFNMSNGEISGNTAYGVVNLNSYGGGVYLFYQTIFVKTGGIIHGYDSSDPVKSNKVIHSGAIQNGFGHAVCYADGTSSSSTRYYKENTVEGNMTANSPAEGILSGW